MATIDLAERPKFYIWRRNQSTYHDFAGKASLSELLTATTNILGGIIGTLRSTPEDDMHVGVPLSFASVTIVREF